MSPDLLADNRRARRDYEFVQEYEAGIVLTGPETKSAKTGGLRLSGAFVVVRGGEAWLIGAHVARFKPAGPSIAQDPDRSRKILLHKKELQEIAGKTDKTGLTLVPVSAYSKGGRVKLRLALARGKQQFEKRDALRKKAVDRDTRRALLRPKK